MSFGRKPLLAMAIVAVLTLAASSFALTRATDRPAPNDGRSYLDDMIAAVERDIDHATSPEARAAALEKLGPLREEKAQIEAARKQPAPTDEDVSRKMAPMFAEGSATPTASSTPTPLRTTDTGAVFRANVWLTNDKCFRPAAPASMWQGPEQPDGTRLAVWAGTYTNECWLEGAKAEGAVFVRVYNPDEEKPRSDTILPAPGHEQLSFVDEQGAVLELRDEADATLYFDTSTLTFR